MSIRSETFGSNANFVGMIMVGKFEGIFSTIAMKHALNFATMTWGNVGFSSNAVFPATLQRCQLGFVLLPLLDARRDLG